MITSPEYLSRGQLAALAAAGSSVVLVEPTAAALAVLAPRARLGSLLLPLAVLPPRCQLPAAAAAGSADAGNIGVSLRPGTAGFACYPADGADSLVRYQAGGRVVTVLGSGLGLANGQLANQGNAALALNLLGRGRIVWLVPPPAAGAGSGRKTFTSLVPLAAWLVAAQLGVALLLTAAWRGRRLGPLIAERLPVVVRAAETVEGHGRLYAVPPGPGPGGRGAAVGHGGPGAARPRPAAGRGPRGRGGRARRPVRPPGRAGHRHDVRTAAGQRRRTGRAGRGPGCTGKRGTRAVNADVPAGTGPASRETIPYPGPGGGLPPRDGPPRSPAVPAVPAARGRDEPAGPGRGEPPGPGRGGPAG